MAVSIGTLPMVAATVAACRASPRSARLPSAWCMRLRSDLEKSAAMTIWKKPTVPAVYEKPREAKLPSTAAPTSTVTTLSVPCAAMASRSSTHCTRNAVRGCSGTKHAPSSADTSDSVCRPPSVAEMRSACWYSVPEAQQRSRRIAMTGAMPSESIELSTAEMLLQISIAEVKLVVLCQFCGLGARKDSRQCGMERQALWAAEKLLAAAMHVATTMISRRSVGMIAKSERKKPQRTIAG
eukprot:3031814-Pleurochrysis_carterae.AAC.3